MESMYDYIKRIGTVHKNRVGLFIAHNPEKAKELDELIKQGKVIEYNNMYKAL